MRSLYILSVILLLVSGVRLLGEEIVTPTPTPTPLLTPSVVVTPTTEEIMDLAKEESIDVSAIKKVIEADQLTKAVEEQNKKIADAKEKAEKLKVEEWYFPREERFWSMMSEYWLIQNTQILTWDIERPDLGIGEAITKLFEKIGYIGKRLKILVINSSEVTHFALPSDPNEFIFLISMPLMSDFKLTTLEIALIALEDYIRSEKGYFKNYVTLKDLSSLWGQNFYQKEDKMDMKILKEIAEKYSFFIFKKGFDFAQQYEVTMKMSGLIKSDTTLWTTYKELLDKFKSMMKDKESYRKYTQIYPSPEIQLRWLTAVKE